MSNSANEFVFDRCERASAHADGPLTKFDLIGTFNGVKGSALTLYAVGGSVARLFDCGGVSSERDNRHE